MKIFIKKEFGEVKGYELGWSPAGKPMMTVHCYRLGPVMVDTGLAHMKRAVLEVVATGRLEAVLLTHHHEDHSGNAAVISRYCRVRVFGHPLTKKKLSKPYGILPYQHLMWGATKPVDVTPVHDTLCFGDISFVPVHTPGHSKDHTVFYVPERGWLFSGDLYLADRIKFFRSDEQIEGHIQSIRKILGYDFDTLFCGHNPKLGDGKLHLKKKLEFLESFFGAVAGLYSKGMSSREIMRRLPYKESILVKAICFGNVSMKHMVRSSIRALEKGWTLDNNEA